MGGKRRGTLERVPHTPRTFPDSFSVARNRHMCPVPVFCFLLPAMYQWFLPLWCLKGACLPCCRRALPSAYVLSPIPPAPPSRREGGRFLVYFAGGFAPGTPALDRLRHLQLLPSMSPVGGLPSLLPTRPAFSFVSCPHPPNPPSQREGGTKSLFCRGLRPRHPCTEPSTALTAPATQAPLWGGGLF